jgi:hypothetical protein
VGRYHQLLIDRVSLLLGNPNPSVKARNKMIPEYIASIIVKLEDPGDQGELKGKTAGVAVNTLDRVLTASLVVSC